MLSIICEAEFKETTDSFTKSKSYPNLLANNHAENIYSNEFFNRFIMQISKSFQSSGTDETIKDLTEKIILEQIEIARENETEKYELVCLAISCLQCFVQANWLGPIPQQTSNLPAHLQKDEPTDIEKKLFFLKDFFNNEEYEAFQDKLRSCLSSDGEYLMPIVKCAHFIYLAKCILLDCASHFKSLTFIDWWSMRALFLYQQLFEERPQTLCIKSLDLIQTLSGYFDESNECKAAFLNSYDKEILRFASIIFHLEATNVYYQNYNWTKAQACYKTALKASDISFELVGVYGKRTKFQQKDVAQLLLKVNETNEKTEHLGLINNFQQWPHFNRSVTKTAMPQDLALNDDTLLDKIKISNEEDEKILSGGKFMSQIEHACLYSTLIDYQKNSPHTELTAEELMPFIEYLLANCSNWSVQVSAMFMRTKLEASSCRRMERSLMQLETLLEHYHTRNVKTAAAKDRLQFFYTIMFPSIWILSKEMAASYMKLGLINSALEIYLKLQMWSDVIRCYQALDKPDQAEALIRERLAIKETPDLYCSLGEVTNEVEHFEKAIELSKGKSANAFRMLAKHKFARQEYAEAIANFEKSLFINPMQYNAWFMLGSAAFRSEDWKTAVKAFRKCTHLEPDSHETWNNLAASYIKLNEKNKAHAVFQEALKYDYDNGKIWENFLWTSTDCCYFEDVIKAYNRLIDLKEKYVDTEVLRALKVSVENKMKDPNEVSIFIYKKSILKLFGRITSITLNNWKIFWYYAEIVMQFGMKNENDMSPIELSPEIAEKSLNLFYKAFRVLYNTPTWDVSVESCDEILSVSIELLVRCVKYGKNLATLNDVYCSLNMTIKSLIKKLKTKYSVDGNNNKSTSGDSKYERLLYLTEVNDKFVKLQEEHEKFREEFCNN